MIIESMYVLIMTAVACSLIGVFLVLRNLAMVADAISHSVLLGIVLAVFVVHDLSSPLLIVGASVFGLLTVLAIELLIKSGLIKNDSAVGIIFPLFFSIGVILISKFGKGIHLDVQCVLMGEVIFAPLNRMMLFGFSLPKALVIMSVMVIINLVFVVVFFKELKVNTFDSEYAQLNGFSASILLYSLMALASVTTVSAFDSVGAILVVAFMVAPAASAYLLTKKLRNTIILAVVIGIIDSIIGFYLSIKLNLSMAGVTAFTMGFVFIIILLIHNDGVISRYINHKNNKMLLIKFFVLQHLQDHYERKEIEHGLTTMHQHLNKPKSEIVKICNKLIKDGYVRISKEQNIYVITKEGAKFYKDLKTSYEL